MANPDPAHITDPMWKLWTDRPSLSWKLGGIYANKKGYHNTVLANKAHWPDNYSIELPLDLVSYNRDKARAIDYTMSDSEMVKWTHRMQASALNPRDHRLAAVKEFYGTLDNKTVYGLSKDNTSGPWNRSTSDPSHLWHGHISIFTAYVNNWLMLEPILSVMEGETFEEWSNKEMATDFPKLGDTGEEIVYWQYIHNIVRNTVSPPCPTLEIDGNYGPSTAAAFSDFWRKIGATGSYNGSFLSGWLATVYHKHFVIVNTPKPLITVPNVDPELLQGLVNEWLSDNVPVPESLVFEGTVTGKVVLP